MKMRREHQKALEGLFVQEFRTCQALYHLTAAERQALSSGDIPHLLALTGQKESTLNELVELEKARQVMLQSLAAMLAIDLQPHTIPTLADLTSTLHPDEAKRLVHLQEGIVVIMNQVRELTQGNRALADYAMQRASTLQTRLFNLWRYAASSQPGETTISNEVQDWRIKNAAQPGSFNPDGMNALPALFAAILTARDALNNRDNSAVSAAIVEMQTALENLSQILERNRARLQQLGGISRSSEETQSTPAALPVSKTDASLIEVMADLYHQEAAYQAVLKVSNRMLTHA
jgi:flagellar biosynthesis/type III secretory pathway chaperone